MSYDLSKLLGGTTGTWSPFGLTLPDYGKTEQAVKSGYLPDTRTFVNPNQFNFASSAPNGITASNSGSVLGANTSGGGGGGGGGGSNPPSSSGFDGIIDAARRAKEAAIARATEAYNQGKNIYDQGMTALGTRRGEFQKMFDDTSSDILGGFEKNRGELQSSAQGAEQRTAMALRALGLGGSSVINARGRQTQENARNLATTQDARVASDRSNASNLGEQNLWANNQETNLTNYLQGLGSAKSQAESGAGVDFSNILNNVTNSLASLQATRGGVADYAANPTDITGLLNANTEVGSPTLDSLQGVASGPIADNSFVNLQQNPSILDLIKKKSTQSLYA